jgi:hypothetical protein
MFVCVADEFDDLLIFFAFGFLGFFYSWFCLICLVSFSVFLILDFFYCYFTCSSLCM